MKKRTSVYFLAEETLGKLAKWLRLLGFDTLFEPDIQKTEARGMGQTGRIFLTRTKARFSEQKRLKGQIFIRSDRVLDQLAEVIQKVGLTGADVRPFSRCIRCNRPIKSINKDEVITWVPEYVWETHQTFKICHPCQKIYWRGSHVERSQEIIKTLFNPKKTDEAE